MHWPARVPPTDPFAEEQGPGDATLLAAVFDTWNGRRALGTTIELAQRRGWSRPPAGDGYQMAPAAPALADLSRIATDHRPDHGMLALDLALGPAADEPQSPRVRQWANALLLDVPTDSRQHTPLAQWHRQRPRPRHERRQPVDAFVRAPLVLLLGNPRDPASLVWALGLRPPPKDLPAFSTLNGSTTSATLAKVLVVDDEPVVCGALGLTSVPSAPTLEAWATLLSIACHAQGRATDTWGDVLARQAHQWSRRLISFAWRMTP